MISTAPITVRARPDQVITTKTDRPGIQVKAQADEAAAVGAAVRRICCVCSKAVAPYVCPRCHIAYCSGTCYKKHGEGCTEAFFRARVEDEIQAREREKQAAVPADKRAEVQVLYCLTVNLSYS
jgi:HIT zinc finger